MRSPLASGAGNLCVIAIHVQASRDFRSGIDDCDSATLIANSQQFATNIDLGIQKNTESESLDCSRKHISERLWSS